MASIRDVAKEAGVGVGTVSRVLNGTGYVADDTRKKIQKAMKELHYTPNELARNLYHKRSGIIAVFVPTVTHPFFAELVDNIEAQLYHNGYKMMICNSAKGGNVELEYLDMLNRHIVDGVICGAHSLDIEEYKKIKKPIVALDRYLGEYIPLITVDHRKGGQMAAEELLRNGCKKILQFVGSEKIDTPYHVRHHEFERIMKEHNLEIYSYELEWNSFYSDYMKKMVRDIFVTDMQFDGVFGMDMLAISYMNEARKRGMRIPEDVKIVSYDGSYMTRVTEPGMTSVVQPIAEIAREAVALIINMISGEKYQNKKVMLDVKLQRGGTTLPV